MATYTKFYAFVEAVCEKKHDLGADQLTIALCNAANAPDEAADAVLTDLTQISYTYCSSRDITTVSSAQTGGTYKLTLQDITLSASGGAVGPFQYVVIYNNGATNDDLIAFYSYGSEITLNDGEDLDVDFDDTNGFFQLA